MLHYNASSNKIFLLFSVKLVDYIFSADSVWSNPCVGPLPRIKISFFLLPVFVDELVSIPKITTFLPTPLLTENSPFLSNQELYPKNLYPNAYTYQYEHLSN